METNVCRCKPQFYYIKVGFKWVKIIKACFRDDECRRRHCKRNSTAFFFFFFFFFFSISIYWNQERKITGKRSCKHDTELLSTFSLIFVFRKYLPAGFNDIMLHEAKLQIIIEAENHTCLGEQQRYYRIQDKNNCPSQSGNHPSLIRHQLSTSK